MGENYSNGAHRFDERFNRVDKELEDIKDHLVSTLQKQTQALEKLSESINGLNKNMNSLALQFSTFLNIAANAIPLKAVFWMFFILVLTISGLEGIKLLSKLYTVSL